MCVFLCMYGHVCVYADVCVSTHVQWACLMCGSGTFQRRGSDENSSEQREGGCYSQEGWGLNADWHS